MTNKPDVRELLARALLGGKFVRADSREHAEAVSRADDVITALDAAGLAIMNTEALHAWCAVEWGGCDNIIEDNFKSLLVAGKLS